MSVNKEQVRQHLESGEQVFYHSWCFSANYMSCGEGCCDDSLNGVDDAMDTIEDYCGGKWEGCELL